MKIVHFCAGLEYWNGMANTARQFVQEELARGDDSSLTNNPADVKAGVDVVVIHGAWLPILWKVSKRTKAIGAKLCIRPAGSYDPVRRAYHGWKKKLVSVFEHRMLRRADVVLATCEAESEWIRSYDPLVKKVEITDLKRFFNLSRVERVDRVENGEIHLLYLGRRHPLKGLEYLEEAVRQLQTSTCYACSTRIGNPARSAPLRLCVKIISSAFGEELEKVWNWCDVLVLPTLSENFGRVIAEALERGKRVITTDGAPAWGDGNDHGGRLVYLSGFRDGTNEARVHLLKDAIEKLMGV